MPPVATTTPSLTRGDALPMRLMAPSTMTWSAPSACSRSTVTRSSASVVGPLTSTAPSPAARPMTTRPSGVWNGSSSSASMA